ncbi:uncharacterized protein LOC117187468 [Drosophila miranda]|uniref:uncharacterized protein LOC117187468 n=1 Tax=Drosophila miranda TaxID=7229 RepID=UPI00143F1672|nr:uncharacterized protein LOC117187468 [Drosophila miranda]
MYDGSPFFFGGGAALLLPLPLPLLLLLLPLLPVDADCRRLGSSVLIRRHEALLSANKSSFDISSNCPRTSVILVRNSSCVTCLSGPPLGVFSLFRLFGCLSEPRVLLCASPRRKHKIRYNPKWGNGNPTAGCREPALCLCHTVCLRVSLYWCRLRLRGASATAQKQRCIPESLT